MNEKMKLIERLVRDGHIGLDEALMLLESEKEYIQIPSIQPSPYVPLPPWDTTPINPYTWPNIIYGTADTIVG